MYLKSNNCVKSILVLCMILQLSLQFSMGHPQSNLQQGLNKLNGGYQVALRDPKMLQLLKSEQTGLQVKGTIELPCQPTSFQIHKQSIVVDVTEDKNSYIVSVVCQNNELINYKYQPDTGKIENMQMKEKQEGQKRGNQARVLQTTSNTTAVCGNSIIQTGEQCDDGNTVSLDGCSITCQYECGDGNLNSAVQQCDDGNRVDGDGCSATCKKEDSRSALGYGLGFGIAGAAVGGIIIGQVALASTVGASASGIVGINPVASGPGLIQVGQTMKMMNVAGPHGHGGPHHAI